MRSFLVIGLGRFGSHLAMKLTELGGEVLALDENEQNVEAISASVDRAEIADCTDEHVADTLGVNNFDVCFVCVGSDFADALEITLLLREKGAKRIVVKTDSDRHSKLLLKSGADEIIYPERDAAKRAARKYMTERVFDYFPLSDDYAIFETEPIAAWCGKSISDLALRTKYNINVIGVMRNNKLIPVTSADFTFESGENVIVAGALKDVDRLLGRL